MSRVLWTVRLAASALIVVVLGSMLAFGDFDLFAFGLGIVCGTLAGRFLSGLGTVAVAVLLASAIAAPVVVVFCAILFDLPEGWVYPGNFLTGAGIFLVMNLLLNRYWQSQGTGGV